MRWDSTGEGAYENMDEGDAILELEGLMGERDYETNDIVKNCFVDLAEGARSLLNTLGPVTLRASDPREPIVPELAVDVASDDEVGESDARPKHIVAMAQRGQVARFHLVVVVGGWRAKALNFTSYEYLFVDPPPVSCCTAFCRDCWPRAPPTFGGEAAASSARCSSSSSSRRSRSSSSS